MDYWPKRKNQRFNAFIYLIMVYLIYYEKKAEKGNVWLNGFTRLADDAQDLSFKLREHEREGHENLQVFNVLNGKQSPVQREEEIKAY